MKNQMTPVVNPQPIRALLIGGARDGEMIDVYQVWQTLSVKVPVSGPGMMTQDYVAGLLCDGDNSTHVVYIHGVEPSKIVRTLIEGYAAKRAQLNLMMERTSITVNP